MVNNKKNFKFPANVSVKTPHNKLCLDIIGSYKVHRKGKTNFTLKEIIEINITTMWFEIIKYTKKNDDCKLSRNFMDVQVTLADKNCI